MAAFCCLYFSFPFHVLLQIWLAGTQDYLEATAANALFLIPKACPREKTAVPFSLFFDLLLPYLFPPPFIKLDRAPTTGEKDTINLRFAFSVFRRQMVNLVTPIDWIQI